MSAHLVPSLYLPSGGPSAGGDAIWRALLARSVPIGLLQELAARIERSASGAEDAWAELDALQALCSEREALEPHLRYLARPRPLSWERLSGALAALGFWRDAHARALGVRTLEPQARSAALERWLGEAVPLPRVPRLVACDFQQLSAVGMSGAALAAACDRADQPALVWGLDDARLGKLPRKAPLGVSVDAVGGGTWRRLRALAPRLVCLRFRSSTSSQLRALRDAVAAAADAGACVVLEGPWDRFGPLMASIMPSARAVLGIAPAAEEPTRAEVGEARSLQWAELCTEFPSQVVVDRGVVNAVPVLFGLALERRTLGPLDGVAEAPPIPPLPPRPPVRLRATGARWKPRLLALTTRSAFALSALRAAFIDEGGRRRPRFARKAPPRAPTGYAIVVGRGLYEIDERLLPVLRACDGKTDIRRLARASGLPAAAVRQALEALAARGVVR